MENPKLKGGTLNQQNLEISEINFRDLDIDLGLDLENLDLEISQNRDFRDPNLDPGLDLD